MTLSADGPQDHHLGIHPFEPIGSRPTPPTTVSTPYPPLFLLGSEAGSLTIEAHSDNMLLIRCEPQQAEPVSAAPLYEALAPYPS